MKKGKYATKQCPLCGREANWLLHHILKAEDEALLSVIKRVKEGWTEEDGVCIPCFEQYKEALSNRNFEIFVGLN